MLTNGWPRCDVFSVGRLDDLGNGGYGPPTPTAVVELSVSGKKCCLTAGGFPAKYQYNDLRPEIKGEHPSCLNPQPLGSVDRRMAHEFDSCACVLCLSFRRVYGLLYAEEATGALQRKGIELLRTVHAQLLDFSEGGGAGSANPVSPELPAEGVVGTKEVKEEPAPKEDQELSKKSKGAPVVGQEEESKPSTAGDREEDIGKEKGSEDTAEKGSAAEESAPSRKERKRSSRERERRRRRDKEEEPAEGVDKRSRSRRRRRQHKSPSRPKSPARGKPVSHSPSRGAEREEARDKQLPRTPSRSPVRRSPKGSLPSRPSGLTNAQKRAIPPPPKPPPVKAPREPDYPPPGYTSWAETDVRSKSQAYRDPPPNKGKKKDERNYNFRLWREYERGYY